MSKKYLVPIDMTGLEIQNFLAHNLAAAPTGVAGKIYFNTVDKKLYYHNGTAWVALPAEYSDATQSVHGLMSTTDKKKLDGIAEGANKTTVDSSMSSTSTNPVQNKVVYQYIADQISAADAMIFKGTIGTGGTVTALPTTYKTGWTYRVITAGTYAGNKCEVGDLIIALVDRSGSGNVDADWTVAQTNIDGAITGLSGTAPISVTGSGASRTITISAATQSAAGSMSANDKKKLDGITATKTGTVTLAKGSTTVDASVADIISYTAKDAATGEEIVLDVTKGSNKVTFSIAAAHTNAITITYLAAA